MMARMSALVIPLITFVYLAITALNHISISTGRDAVGSSGVFVFMSLLTLLLVLVLLLVQLLWAAEKLGRLALWCASRLGPEPWLSLVSVGVALAAGIGGGIILQLEPTIAAPDWLIGAIMTMWFGFDCVVVLLVRAIDTEAPPRHLPEPEPVRSAPDVQYGLKH
jgi:hypothetical protein